MSAAKKYRKKIVTMVEALVLLDKRIDDDLLAVSPKGISAEGWEIANDMAVGLRMAMPSFQVTTIEEMEYVAGATSMVIGMQEKTILVQRLFPKGPNHLLEIMKGLNKETKGQGFGKILQTTAQLVYKLETKQY